jgi:hypothetical protein
MTGREKSYEALGDMMDELHRLHEETHPPRQPGEFTIAEYAKINNMDVGKAGAELRFMAEVGKIEKISEKRFIDSNLRTVYKMIAKS